MSWKWVMLSAAGALVVAGALFGRNPHPHMWWETIPAYGAAIGYGGAWVLIILAKSILAPLLRRDDQAAPHTEGEV